MESYRGNDNLKYFCFLISFAIQISVIFLTFNDKKELKKISFSPPLKIKLISSKATNLNFKKPSNTPLSFSLENFNNTVSQNELYKPQLKLKDSLAITKKQILENSFNGELSFNFEDFNEKDEYNSNDKKFFQFYRRVSMQYFNSFALSYKKVSKKNHFLETIFKETRDHLIGRIHYDLNGNVVKIKILKSTMSNSIHELFEETLKNIGIVSNPPKELLNESQELVFYYRLKINSPQTSSF